MWQIIFGIFSLLHNSHTEKLHYFRPCAKNRWRPSHARFPNCNLQWLFKKVIHPTINGEEVKCVTSITRLYYSNSQHSTHSFNPATQDYTPGISMGIQRGATTDMWKIPKMALYIRAWLLPVFLAVLAALVEGTEEGSVVYAWAELLMLQFAQWCNFMSFRF